MLTKVHKITWNLREGNVKQIEIPKNATLLSADCQDQEAPHVSVWFKLHSPATNLKRMLLTSVETGKEVIFEEGWEFLDTVLMLDGAYVVHIFYKEL